MGNTSRMSGVFVGVRPPFTLALYRFLALGLIFVLLQMAFPVAECMALATHQATMLESSRNNPARNEGDAGCCSFCFCCHFLGVMPPADPRPALSNNGWLAAGANPLTIHSSINPFDRPPKA